MEVHISEIAFMGMVLAGVEAFRKETYGLLLGQGTRQGLVVQYAVPYQTADRHAAWVTRNESAHRRMEKILENVRHLNLIGDFHSHTVRRRQEALCALSGADEEGLAINDVCVVLALNPKRRRQPWRHNKGGTISGTVGDYFVKIGAWFQDEKGFARRARLYCPFAIGLTWH